jgi:hypothetical protein
MPAAQISADQRLRNSFRYGTQPCLPRKKLRHPCPAWLPHGEIAIRPRRSTMHG